MSNEQQKWHEQFLHPLEQGLDEGVSMFFVHLVVH